MNKEKFIEFLNKPSLLKEHNLSELDDLVSENPYFQAGRILEAKGNRLLKTSAAGKKTASAAIYSTNRILLKKYLAGDGTIIQKPAAERPVQAPEKKAEAPKASSTTTPSQPATKPPVSEETIPEPQIQDTPTGPDSPGTSSIDQLIYSLKQDMKELEVSRARYIEVARKIEEEDAVEKAVKKATKHSEVDTTPNVWKSYKPSDKPAEAKEEKASEPKSSTKSGTTKKAPAKSTKAATAKKSTTSTTKTGAAKKTTTKKKPATKSTTKSTAAKTKASSTTKSASKTTAKKTTAKKATTKASTSKSSTKTSAKKSAGRTSRSSKSASSTKKDDSDSDNQRELIDQFIKANPSFKPSRDAKNIEDLSSESTSLHDDLASEYLAEIFMGQGKKDQAIKIYNSLMLRFPEKKAYFAGRIKKIK
ncbi:MAG: hypothetical protein ACFHWX_11545 [Bacteroidota bacterium]